MTQNLTKQLLLYAGATAVIGSIGTYVACTHKQEARDMEKRRAAAVEYLHNAPNDNIKLPFGRGLEFLASKASDGKLSRYHTEVEFEVFGEEVKSRNQRNYTRNGQPAANKTFSVPFISDSYKNTLEEIAKKYE